MKDIKARKPTSEVSVQKDPGSCKTGHTEQRDMSQSNLPRCSDLSSAEFAAFVGRSVSTVVRWAKGGHPAARWDKWRKEWRWIEKEYEAELNRSTRKPLQEMEVQKRRGPKPRYGT